MSGAAQRRTAWLDAETGGAASIAGTVKLLTSAVKRPVYLFTQDGLSIRRSTWSDPVTGEYAFQHIAQGTEWLVMSIDTSAAYNAVVSDRVQT